MFEISGGFEHNIMYTLVIKGKIPCLNTQYYVHSS